MQINREEALCQNEYQEQNDILKRMVKRFATYGYRQIQPPIFEDYSLYQTIKGTVRTKDMIKVIAPAGNILVLRPDVTIPITRRAAIEGKANRTDKRFCYTSSIFRNTNSNEKRMEQTQAGIENFEPESTQLDAEVLTLAIHTLQDFGFTKFKLVIGHAGFFKELLSHIHLSEQETAQLQTLIQAKNVSGIEAFLQELSIDEQSKHALLQIPLLYGDPANVLKHVSAIAINKPMQDKAERMLYLLEILTMYGVESFVTFDFGLINHMDYYTDIIFQGFVEDFGRPVLMGGRYNQLAEQLYRPMPAIGFAFYMDAIFTCMKQQSLFPDVNLSIDIHIYYTKIKQGFALTTAQWLRQNGINVLTTSWDTSPEEPIGVTTLYCQNQQNLLDTGDERIPVTNRSKLLDLLKGET